jgi:methenyltetrahydromethanopterin cyclohydrolase
MRLKLNHRADQLVMHAASESARLRLGVTEQHGATLLDFGVDARGGLDAGILLARICMADLASIRLVPDDGELHVPQIQVTTDHPIEACLLSQYAGWKIATNDYFAMGSGPMRILAGVEDLQKELNATDDRTCCVGVLEASALPSRSAIEYIRETVGRVGKITLLTAPTASIAGTIQIVARSVETAMHKLHAISFPLDAVVSGVGKSPLPPVAKDSLQGIGRTNDAILYGATVNLTVDCDDQLIESRGPKVPSSASESHGRTFEELFAEADHDFYRLDPDLFSPAVVVFHNLRSGHSFEYGHRVPELLATSFGLS